jgi:hypothetical protein
MTVEKSKFTSFNEKNVGHVIFGDDTKRKVKGIINIENYPVIEHVLLIDGLKYNLQNISPLCDR